MHQLDPSNQNAPVGSNNITMPKTNLSNKHIDIIKWRDEWFKAVQNSQPLAYTDPFEG